ncbi:MAG TPA: site-2 protease family protein [Candidatus Limnocylindria bacterium]|jgi:Zn-dependent protease
MIFQAGPEVLIGLLIALVLGTTFHEFSHAFVADQLGDHRPRAMGRVSLNPLHHLDPMGTIFFLIAGFGWGKPVMVNAYALRPGRVGMAWVAVAGPLANLVVATVFAVVFRGAEVAGVFDSQAGGFLGRVLLWIVEFNVILGLFNLLPIPPLDGYNLVLPFLPLRTALTVQRYAVYGVLVLLVLVLLPRLGGGFSPLDWLFNLAQDITRLLIGA